MGLASKLAATQQYSQQPGQPGQAAAYYNSHPSAPGYSQQPPPPQQQQQYGSYAPPPPVPGRPQYGTKPVSYGQPQQQYPPPTSPGYGQPQQSYGAPPMQGQYSQQPAQYAQQPPQQQQASNVSVQYIQSILEFAIGEQKLQGFYPPGSAAVLAQRIVSSGALDVLRSQWKIPAEIASDLAKLALFDIILYIDDSGSMAFEENGSRIDDLKLVMSRVAFASSLFDTDGISVRFMNSAIKGDNINSDAKALQLLQGLIFKGITPLGTSLREKIIDPLVIAPALDRATTLRKPVLIVTITDGAPVGEDRQTVAQVIQYAVSEMAKTRYGADALSFQFAQVGNDMGAQQFLRELDTHPRIGSLIDCTSNYELEADEMMKKSGIDFTPDLWIVKMLLGAIDNSYDDKDERNNFGRPKL